jgi:hypothetical protein
MVDLPSPLRSTIATRSPGDTSSETPRAPDRHAQTRTSHARAIRARTDGSATAAGDSTTSTRVENLADALERYARRREASQRLHERLMGQTRRI